MKKWRSLNECTWRQKVNSLVLHVLTTSTTKLFYHQLYLFSDGEKIYHIWQQNTFFLLESVSVKKVINLFFVAKDNHLVTKKIFRPQMSPCLVMKYFFCHQMVIFGDEKRFCHRFYAFSKEKCISSPNEYLSGQNL